MHTDGLRLDPGFARDRSVLERLTAAGRFAFSEAGHVNVAALAGELDRLAEKIARIRPPSARNPHAFHEDRSEVAHAAREIAQWLRTGRKPVDL